jgi:hypothetical protein
MPYKSHAQERLMRGVAHSPDFARKVGIPQSVGRKFEDHKSPSPQPSTSHKVKALRRY